jgi:hypothetical protein
MSSSTLTAIRNIIQSLSQNVVELFILYVEVQIEQEKVKPSVSWKTTSANDMLSATFIG